MHTLSEYRSAITYWGYPTMVISLFVAATIHRGAGSAWQATNQSLSPS